MNLERKTQSENQATISDVFGQKAVRVANNLFFYLLCPYTLFLIFGLTLSKEYTISFSELHRLIYSFDYITAIFLMVISSIYYVKVRFGNLTLLSILVIITIFCLFIAPDMYKEYISKFPIIFLFCTINLISIIYVLHITRIAEIKVYKK